MSSPTAPLSAADLAARTPSDRDRVVDLVRGGCIVVVVLWHWTFSVTRWSNGSLSMPNPIGEASGLWLLTWLFQVMPLFFVVGGFSNLAGWTSSQQRDTPSAARSFIRSRLDRLGRPALAMVAAWVVVDALIRVSAPGTASVVEWGTVVFVPLWFLATYGMVTALAPLTVALHRRARSLTVVGLGATIVLGDLARFSFGIGLAGYVTTIAVWVFAHQLGYWWRDGSLTALPREAHAALAAAGLTGMIVLTNIGVYPRSTVAVEGEWMSNMFPTTALIACLAVFQLGLVLLARPGLNRWLLRSRTAWRNTVAINAISMTVFCWHMTALVLVVGAWHLAGESLLDEPTITWWLQRPIWLIGPALVLAPIVKLFVGVETRSRAS